MSFSGVFLKVGGIMNKILSVDAKRFYKQLAALVIPIAIQNFITSAVGSADVLMLGYVGQSALSAVSLANQYQFILSGVFFGIASGITMLCSQYWGKKDTKSIQAVMGIAFKISFTLCFFISVACIFAPETMMRIYTDDTNLIKLGVKYLKITGISYVLMSVSQVYLSTLRSIERAKVSTIISSVALGLNIVLNATFIFGPFGLPKLGVVGVALATTISRVVECVLCLVDLSFNKSIRINFSIFFGKHKALFKDYLKYSLPALGNDISWTLAFSTYSIIMGHMNSDMVAASSVATTVRDLCTVLCFGMAAGGSVLLGIEIGEGRVDNVKKDAKRLCHITLLCGAITGIIILLIRPIVFYCFTLTDRASDYLNIMLWISSYYVIGQAINTVTIAGIFRAGGDSKFGLICDTITMWVVSVPLGFISAFVLKLPPMWVYFILCLDEFWKEPVVYWRYKSYKWIKDITRKYEN